MFPTEQFTCCQSTWWLFKQSITWFSKVHLYFTRYQQSFQPKTLFSVVTINPSSLSDHSPSFGFFSSPAIFFPQNFPSHNIPLLFSSHRFFPPTIILPPLPWLLFELHQPHPQQAAAPSNSKNTAIYT